MALKVVVGQLFFCLGELQAEIKVVSGGIVGKEKSRGKEFASLRFWKPNWVAGWSSTVCR